MTRPAVPAEALVLHALAADAPPGPPPALESCSLCGGPPRLCGGLPRRSGAVATPNELRRPTGIRRVYGALLLTPTPASRWGGSLLRMGRLVVAGRPRRRGFADVAAEHAPLLRTPHLSSLPVSPPSPTSSTRTLIGSWELRELVDLAFWQGSLSPWLVYSSSSASGPRSRRLDKVRVFPVFAVRCEKCWGTNARGSPPAAFRARRHLRPGHPLPGLRGSPDAPAPGREIVRPPSGRPLRRRGLRRPLPVHGARGLRARPRGALPGGQGRPGPGRGGGGGHGPPPQAHGFRRWSTPL